MNRLLVVIFLMSSQMVFGQAAQPLALKKKLQREINPGGKDVYTLKLKANQFNLVMVIQDGVDLQIKTMDRTGKELETFDSPNGRQGPEMVTLTSTLGGIYSIEVTPLSSEEPAGKYTIELLNSEPKATTPEKMIDQLIAGIILPGYPGATIAVGKGSEILFSKGYGLAEPEYNIANTPKTVFHIASVSKQFTAFSIAMLVDQNKISLDDDIHKYLPELHDFGQTITIRHLIHHTSGLRDQWNLLALAGWRLDDVITRNQVLRLISHQTELNDKPGDEFNYCNTGYTLAAEIVSRVTGKSFADWTAENIFKPLEMANTLFYDDHEKIVANRAYSFQVTNSEIKKSVLSYANAGATSLFTTAEDLLKWSDNFLTMKVGNAKVMKMMEERGILNKGDTLSYAFGQDGGFYKGVMAFAHGGSDAGYRSFLIRFPEQKISIAVLSNLGSFDPGRLAYKIADIYLKGSLKEEPKKEEVAKPNVQVNPEILKTYCGQYELQPGFVVTVRMEGENLVVQLVGQPPFPMNAKSETEFEVSQFDGQMAFTKNTNNEVNEFVLTTGGNVMKAPRLKEFDPKSITLSDYTGVFYSPELETRYTVVLEGDKLKATHIRNEPCEIHPVADGIFNADAWYMGRIEFIKNPQGVVTGMKVSSGRVKNVKFDKFK
ncbi:MAG: serine hydrolase [Cyclobacteriaceae bacterium]|nr:serine hydrolase [Cyclobacteriaceae bacterium]